MSAIDELKTIVSNQKTIRTSRLAPILKNIEIMYIQQAKKMKEDTPYSYMMWRFLPVDEIGRAHV